MDMDYKVYLDYTMELLSQIKVPNYIIEPPYKWNNQFDGELRQNIYKEASFDGRQNEFSDFISSNVKDNTILSVHDNLSCEYIYIKLPDSSNVFMAGPFSYEKYTEQRIKDLCSYNSIPAHFNEFMQLYFSSLTVFADERCISGIINCLCSKLWDSYTIEKKRIGKALSSNSYKEDTPTPTQKSVDSLEERYKNEAILMEYISHGDYKAVENMKRLNCSDIKPRLSDSIRDRKNLMIILNTLCRKAAQTAYVHPVHLDEISRKFSIRIEACTSVSQLEALESEITRKYCLLVQSYSLRTYSKPIQNIINYITFNLTADLSLNAISEEFLLNSSYLSTLFKKETGMTLTNFVNNKRIEHAIYLLNTTQSAIQDIAAQCGINDVNYFTKLFKKLKQMTPTQYREMIQHK